MVSGIRATGQVAAFREGKLRVLSTFSGRTGGGNLRAYSKQGAEQPDGGQQHGIHRQDAYQGQREQEKIPEETGGIDDRSGMWNVPQGGA